MSEALGSPVESLLPAHGLVLAPVGHWGAFAHVGVNADASKAQRLRWRGGRGGEGGRRSKDDVINHMHSIAVFI